MLAKMVFVERMEEAGEEKMRLAIVPNYPEYVLFASCKCRQDDKD